VDEMPSAAERNQVEQSSAGRLRRIGNAAPMSAPLWSMLLLLTVLFLRDLPQILALCAVLVILPFMFLGSWQWLKERARTEPKVAAQLAVANVPGVCGLPR
jgi:hypothetical protein